MRTLLVIVAAFLAVKALAQPTVSYRKMEMVTRADGKQDEIYTLYMSDGSIAWTVKRILP